MDGRSTGEQGSQRAAAPGSLGVGVQIATFACHLGAVVFLTWPLATHLATHRPATSIASSLDTPFLAWALAHQSRILLAPLLGLAHGSMFHPTPHALFYGEAAFGALPYFLPTFLVTGNPTLALNLVFLVCSAATAWAVHAVVTRMCASWGAGLVAGWLYLTAPSTLWGWVSVAPNYAVMQYLPFIVLLSWRPSGSTKHSAALLGLLALQFLTSAYVAVAVGIPLAVLAATRLARPHTRVAGARLLGLLTLAGAIALPFYAGYVLVRLDNPHLGLQTNWPMPATTPLPIWLGSLFDRIWPAGVPPVCYPLIAIGATLRWIRRRSAVAATPSWAWQCGAYWTVLGTLLGMRPAVEVAGVAWSTPMALVAHWTPLYDAIRVPERLAVGGRIGHVILVGLALVECQRALARTRLGRLPLLWPAVLAAVMYGGVLGQRPGPYAVLSLARPYPLKEVKAPDPVILDAIRSHPGPLVELPAGTRAASNVGAMYRAIYHGQPILNGYSGYWPAAFPDRMALARQLPSADALARLVHDTGLRTVLVQVNWLPRSERAAWLKLAADDEGSPFVLLVREGPVLLFSVRR